MPLTCLKYVMDSGTHCRLQKVYWSNLQLHPIQIVFCKPCICSWPTMVNTLHYVMITTALLIHPFQFATTCCIHNVTEIQVLHPFSEMEWAWGGAMGSSIGSTHVKTVRLLSLIAAHIHWALGAGQIFGTSTKQVLLNQLRWTVSSYTCFISINVDILW